MTSQIPPDDSASVPASPVPSEGQFEVAEGGIAPTATGPVTPAPPAAPGKSAMPGIWPIEADRLAVHMPLVECLRLLAGHYGRRTSISSLVAGLPIPKTGITPVLFTRAAERADMHARLVERSLEATAIAPNLPCILVLDNNQACILWEVKHSEQFPPKKEPGQDAIVHPQTQFLVQFPETSDEKQTIPLSSIRDVFSGYAFYLRPVARHDERAGPAAIEGTRDWFWGVLRKHKRIYQQVVLAAVMTNLFAIVTSLFTMNVYDRVVPNNAFETLWVLASGVLVVYLFDFTIKNLRSHFLDHAGRRADVEISGELFEQIMGMTMTARPASAGILANHMRDFEGLRDFFTSATMATLVDLPFLFIFIVLIAVIAGPLAFVPLAAIPIVIGTGLLLQKPLQRVTKQSMNESALKNAHLFETIAGLETIKVQAAEGHTQRKWEELTEKAARTSVKSRHISSFGLNFAMMIQSITSVFVVVYGVYLISDGSITMGALVASVILSGRAMAPLSAVAGLLVRFNQSRESLKQLDELMKRPVERPADRAFISKPHFAGKVEFQDVIFHYPNQAVPALNRVSFTIEAGDRIGIIGAVGSGKTTLERLLLNLYQPDSGSVQIDLTDVRQIDPGDLRRAVGVVQQSPYLFYGSVRDNITMGHETIPERAVVRAAEIAGVMEFLRDSQLGLDTPVGERGDSLSGGQRQSVAIARSLLYDPPIMVLDEPTGSMDPASENRLLKRLHEVCKGKTTILITHKGAMLSLVDKIMLIDRGRVVAFGPRDDVINKLQNRQYGTTTEQA